MKVYIAVTGMIFFIVLAAHVARVFVEGFHLLAEPVFISTSFLSVGMIIWAIVLLTRLNNASR